LYLQLLKDKNAIVSNQRVFVTHFSKKVVKT